MSQHKTDRHLTEAVQNQRVNGDTMMTTMGGYPQAEVFDRATSFFRGDPS